MSKYSELAENLQKVLGLSVPPVAVCIVDEVPAGIPTLGRPLAAGCMFWQEALRGPFATSAPQHESCAIGVYTHNMAGASAAQQTELGEVLRVMADLTYVRREDVPLIPVLRQQARHIIYAPLAETPHDPDVVLLFAHSRQGLLITEAAQQVDPDIPPALGRPACAVVPQAVNTGRAALSLGCCGARAYLDILSDDIALWALPGPRLAIYAERIVALANANKTLTKFHAQRKKDFAAGLRPTVQASLARM